MDAWLSRLSQRVKWPLPKLRLAYLGKDGVWQLFSEGLTPLKRASARHASLEEQRQTRHFLRLLFREFDRPRLADDIDLDRTRILHGALDLGRNVAREFDSR